MQHTSIQPVGYWLNSRTCLQHLLFTILAMCGSISSFAGDVPDSLVGRWVIKSTLVDGKDGADFFAFVPECKVGALWKLFQDGTCEFAGKKGKWTYDKEKGSFSMSREGVIFGYNEWISSADASMSEGNLVIKYTALFQTIQLTFTPQPK
ncbi:MAG: hypothetical protein ACKVY0_20990 [Prosthecobacter sp.]|uniref:hypothetical protein n=1 Tax=Prosthecobacter sp. TaxID=1965333 RepID=UPI0039019943